MGKGKSVAIMKDLAGSSKKMRSLLVISMMLMLWSADTVVAQDPAAATGTLPKIDAGDTAWVLISAAMVMLMTPGLAFFYGGLVRRKNILSILMQCFMTLCLVTVQWVVFGYSVAFGPDKHGLIGGLEWAALSLIDGKPNPEYAATIPHSAFMMFQMMFAVITPSLIIGAFAERIRFSAFCVFTILWTTLVYDPVAHWVWGVGGFMRDWGTLDFAGGTVVHVNAGMAALAASLVLGRRQGYPHKTSSPHSLPLAFLGASILWFGWFGFNAGSALGANGLAATALVATQVAGAVAGLTWAGLDWFVHKKPTTLGIITGAVGGLVAITPAAGYVNAVGAMAIGLGAGILPWLAVTFLKNKLGYDDSLDAFGVHGVGGIWGALATGLFATKMVNPAADGLLYGNPGQFLIQCKAVALVMAFSFVSSFVLLKAINVVIKLRVNEHDERVGLDLTQHKEAGYTVIE